MSRFVFNPKKGPILVQAEATGPLSLAGLNMMLDTGATTSLVSRSLLIHIGMDLNQSTRHVRMTTGSRQCSGVEVVPIVFLTGLVALGQHRFGFPIIAHNLPTNSAIDGLLGLDFLRDHLLTIDFPAGLIRLA